MEPTISGLSRRRVLTNPTAEFVEKRVAKAVIAQVLDPNEMENLSSLNQYAPELGQFAPKGPKVDLDKYYQESKKGMEKFQQTLRNFVRLLRERNVDKELNVAIKDPAEFTMRDALAIIHKIQEGRDPKHMTSFKAFIQKCYRKAEKHRGAIETILAMLPTDSYGSVISGGFTMILAAVEKHAQHRQAMHDFLAEIPQKLECIQLQAGLHLDAIRVHTQLDSVLVSIFVVLERIVNELTQTWRGKIKDKAKSLFGSLLLFTAALN